MLFIFIAPLALHLLCLLSLDESDSIDDESDDDGLTLGPLVRALLHWVLTILLVVLVA